MEGCQIWYQAWFLGIHFLVLGAAKRDSGTGRHGELPPDAVNALFLVLESYLTPPPGPPPGHPPRWR